MTAILCAVLSGVLFYVSTGVNVALWPLAWLAPVPVLWLAYGEARRWKVFVAAFAAMLGGLSNIVVVYLPVGFNPALVIALTVYALVFAVVVMLSRLVVRRLPPLAAMWAFPCLWTAWEWVVSISSPDGTFGSWAYSQVSQPVLIQSAALFGPWGITFLLSAVASAVALALRQPGRTRLALAGVAAALFAANLAWGLVRLSATSAAPAVLTAAIASDHMDDAAFARDPRLAAKAGRSYAAAARGLARHGVQAVVLPEKLAILTPQTAEPLLAPLQAVADETGVVIVAGFDERGPRRINRSLALRPRTDPAVYAKRRLVPGLERAFTPGDRAGLFSPGLATVVCKDMDFPQMLRGDAREGIGLMLVPAWDFDRDARAHAQMAFLRGVEGGYSIVRSARNGWVSVSDDRGRVLARASTADAPLAVAIAPVSLSPIPTLYLTIGDALGWATAVLSALLIGWALVRRRDRREPPSVH